MSAKSIKELTPEQMKRAILANFLQEAGLYCVGQPQCRAAQAALAGSK